MIKYLLILVLIFSSFNSKPFRMTKRKIEKHPWHVLINGDTLKLICCDWGYIPDDTSIYKFKTITFYKKHLFSSRVRNIEARDEPFIRYGKNFPYKFKKIQGKQFLFISDKMCNRVYSYQILSSVWNVKDSINIVMLKPRDEKLFSDPDYHHPGFPLPKQE